jgi:hypothetical protein
MTGAEVGGHRRGVRVLVGRLVESQREGERRARSALGGREEERTRVEAAGQEQAHVHVSYQLTPDGPPQHREELLRRLLEAKPRVCAEVPRVIALDARRLAVFDDQSVPGRKLANALGERPRARHEADVQQTGSLARRSRRRRASHSAKANMPFRRRTQSSPSSS